MIKELILFIILHNALIIIANKYNFKSKLQCLSNRLKNLLIYKLSECEFCRGHLIGCFLLIPFVIRKHNLNDLSINNLMYLVFPLLSISAIFLIQRK